MYSCSMSYLYSFGTWRTTCHHFMYFCSFLTRLLSQGQIDLETTFKSGLEAPGDQSLRKQNCFLETLKAHLQLSGVPTPSPCTYTFSHGLSRTPTRLHTSSPPAARAHARTHAHTHTRTGVLTCAGTQRTDFYYTDHTSPSGVTLVPSHGLFPTHRTPHSHAPLSQ